jgi:hypothetical protein
MIFQHLCAVHGNFTRSFLSLAEEPTLVLYNDRSSVRVIQMFGDLSPDVSAGQSAGTMNFRLLRIRHNSFADICEIYLFKGQIFGVIKYIVFALEDL